jgi:hypothetical protein
MSLVDNVLYMDAFPYESDEGHLSKNLQQRIKIPPNFYNAKVAKITYLSTHGDRRELPPNAYRVLWDCVVPLGEGWPAVMYEKDSGAVEVHFEKAEAGHEATAQPQHIE